MHSIGKAVLQAAATSLVKETISTAASAARGKSRSNNRSIDQGQQQLNRSIEQGINNIIANYDNIKSKLDGIARKDLLASISFFNEGFVYLCQIFDEETTGVNVYNIRGKVAPGSKTPSPSTAWPEAISLINALKPDLDDSARRALSDAKERFKDARRKATKAFCNEALSTDERILAIRYRVAATLLEKVENPAEALGACKLCLEELHSMPAVEDTFDRNGGAVTKIHKEVCDVNSVICDVTQLVGNAGELLNWPCVVGFRNGKIDPLHNERSRILTGHCCLTWSFGQEGEEKHKLKFAWSIASNTRGDFIVADSVDRNIKVFNDEGKFLYSLDPFAEESQPEYENEFWNVATDHDDSVYVLTLRRSDVPMANLLSEMHVFNKHASLSHKFALREGFRGRSIAVDDHNHVFVTGGTFSDFHDDVVEVYNTSGEFVLSFGKEHLTNAQDIAIADEGRVMVLEGEEYPRVKVFSAEGEFLQEFTVKVIQGSMPDSGVAITFHKPSETVLVASLQSEGSVVVSMYSKNGHFVRAIQFKTKGGPFITGITATAKGRIAVPGQNIVLFA
ncbi:hypothetical protein ACROYT_G033612 [Oculina patagonica]